MAVAQVLISIGTIIISFIIGCVFYFVMSPVKKNLKKEHIQKIISLLIDMVIFIWISKVIVNISQFIRDPLAVLAYPSDSSAFYIAIGIMLVYLAYKQKRSKLLIEPPIDSFVPIFIVASFVYEFIQIIWFGKSWPYMALLMILIMLYLLIDDKLPRYIISGFAVITWSLGQLLLTFILPYMSVFNYIIDPWFFIVIMIVTLLYVILKRKKVSF